MEYYDEFNSFIDPPEYPDGAEVVPSPSDLAILREAATERLAAWQFEGKEVSKEDARFANASDGVAIVLRHEGALDYFKDLLLDYVEHSDVLIDDLRAMGLEEEAEQRAQNRAAAPGIFRVLCMQAELADL